MCFGEQRRRKGSIVGATGNIFFVNPRARSLRASSDPVQVKYEINILENPGNFALNFLGIVRDLKTSKDHNEMSLLKLKISLRSLRDYALESKSNTRAEKTRGKTPKRNYFTDSRVGDQASATIASCKHYLLLISRPSLKFIIFARYWCIQCRQYYSRLITLHSVWFVTCKQLHYILCVQPSMKYSKTS